MSRKGTASGSKSKKIPRIFRSRQSPSSGRAWALCDPVSLVCGNVERTETNDEHKYHENKKKEDFKETSAAGCQLTCNGTGLLGDAETVASIEKWLKTRTESVSSMDLDVIKSEVEEGVDRYMGDDLPHAFLGKDPDVLSMDMDLSDKKLSLGYDPLLQELQSDKLLEACEKDEFILPAFQLDHLDSLVLAPDDMMVAGEILPSTSTHPILSVARSAEPRSAANKGSRDQDASPEVSPRDTLPEIVVEESQVEQDEALERNERRRCMETVTNPSRGIMNVYVEAVGPVDLDTTPVDPITNVETVVNSEMGDEPRMKFRLEPGIIKKRRKAKIGTTAVGCGKIGEQPDSKEGIMALVAISTDKISNMTQIVINTGKEEQIYQGKTSELIEATGNLPQLPKIETTSPCNSVTESIMDGSINDEHELVLSNALGELGITDDIFEPVSLTEHGKVWLCPQEDCSRQFNRLYALKGHILSHFGIRPFKCDFDGCAWAFYSEFKLKRHKETHLKRKDYVCEVKGCDRRFTTIYNLWTHGKLHNRPNKIACYVPDCNEKFQTKKALDLHMKSHDQSHAPYVCKQEGCGKRYYSSNALTSHQRCHSYKEIDVKCSWPGCGKVFDKPCRLKAHIRSHTGCKPYLCNFQGCHWAFSSSSKLKRHQKKHTNERKFVCDIPSCGKAFMRSEHLKEHRLRHSEGRYFQCHMCYAKFTAKSSLYVHIKKHKSRDNSIVTTSNSVEDPKQSEPNETQCSRIGWTIPNIQLMDRTYADGHAETNNETTDMNSNENVTSRIKSLGNHFANKTPSRSPGSMSRGHTRMTYHCPVETCGKSYATRATLRAHMLRLHGMSIALDEKTLSVSDISEPSTDYILYTTSPPVPQPTDHMIMVAPRDALILSTSPEMEPSLPEPEPPPLNSLLKISQPSYRNSANYQSSEQYSKRDQGSARTGLTCSDISRLKGNSTIINSVVGATDVVLGAAGLVEGLLLPEELPSMYYQDDIVGTECQVLLLDSGSPESTISLRDLE